MKKVQYLFSTLLLTLCLGTVSSIAGGGNGPNSGSGGNTNNNSSIDRIIVYHQHGNGTGSMMAVPPGAVAAHAGHGDLWYFTGCPLTGPEHGCEN